MLLPSVITSLLISSAFAQRCTKTTNCGTNRQCSVYGWCGAIPSTTVGLHGAQPITFGNRMLQFGQRMQVGSTGVDAHPIIRDHHYIPPSTLNFYNHGGRVMNATNAEGNGFNVYVIYWGLGWTQADKNTIDFFLRNSASGSATPDPWSGVYEFKHTDNGQDYYADSTYYRDTLSSVSYSGAGYSTTLTNENIKTIIDNAITTGALAEDPSGIYLFLGDANTRQQSTAPDLPGSSCTNFCGWHDWMHPTGGQKSTDKFNFFAYVQHPGAEGSECWTQCGNRLNTKFSYFDVNTPHTSPNGNVATDQVVDIIYHELVEFVTDQNGNAYFDDNTGEEAADVCSEYYGVLSPTNNLWPDSTSFNYNHVPQLAKGVKNTKPYYYNVEIWDWDWTEKRRYLLSAVYVPNKVRNNWTVALGCTTGVAAGF